MMKRPLTHSASPEEHPFEEAIANARLITAAPDMLAVLRDLVDRCSNNDETGHWSCWEEARAAIAKAEGR